MEIIKCKIVYSFYFNINLNMLVVDKFGKKVFFSNVAQKV